MAWRRYRCVSSQSQVRVARLANCPNKLKPAAEVWEKAMRSNRAGPVRSKAMLGQLTNPTCGKGQHALKTSSLRMTNVEGFWLTEYLKLVGLFTVGVPRLVKGSADRKTYVLASREGRTWSLRRVMQNLRHALLLPHLSNWTSWQCCISRVCSLNIYKRQAQLTQTSICVCGKQRGADSDRVRMLRRVRSCVLQGHGISIRCHGCSHCTAATSGFVR